MKTLRGQSRPEGETEDEHRAHDFVVPIYRDKATYSECGVWKQKVNVHPVWPWTASEELENAALLSDDVIYTL
jgi:hypothetical protein